MIKKTLLTALLTAPLLGASLHSAYAATEFNDISNSYAKDAINKLVEAGILNGNGSGQFNPTGKISRQDFAIILVKGLGLDIEPPTATPTFSDVPTSHYAYKYVEAAVKAGLLKGTGGGQFGLGQNLSRQDMAVIFARALGVNTQGYGQSLTFSDADQIADYAKDAVGFAVANGLLTGTGGGKFDPTRIADRQSVALVASRFIQTLKPQNPTQPVPQPTNPTPSTPAVPVPAPVVNVPSTPQVPAPSGNTGGSTETPVRDVQPPVLTLISVAPFKIGTDLTVRSNETGTVYLVPSTSNVSNKSMLDGLVAEGQGVKTAVTVANSDTLLPTSTLTAGAYQAYAVDASGNVSAPVTEIMLKQMLQGPEFAAFSDDLMGASFAEVLNIDSHPSAEDFTITRLDSEMPTNIRIFELNLYKNKIEFIVYDPLVKGGTYQVVYEPKAGSLPFKTLAGKVYGPFVSTFTYTNNAPSNTHYFQDLTLASNTSPAIDLAGTFKDLDDDHLTYTASSDHTDIVDASVENGMLDLHAKSTLGTATITLTAKDGNGGEAITTFKVTVVDAGAALTAAEQAIEEDKDLTNKSSDRTKADEALITAQVLLASLPDEESKITLLNRLKVVEDTLQAIDAAEAKVKALEEATADDKTLLIGEEDRETADAADLAETNFQYSTLVTGKSLDLLRGRAAAARLFIANADALEGDFETIKNDIDDSTDLTFDSPDRLNIDQAVSNLSYEGVTSKTKEALQSNPQGIYGILRNVTAVYLQIIDFEQAVEAAEGKPADAPEWETARQKRAAIDYSKLNTATHNKLKNREDATASKLPSTPPPTP